MNSTRTAPVDTMACHRIICLGSGEPPESRPGSIYPYCRDCGREFSAQGRKAKARLGNPWKDGVPRHYRVASEQVEPVLMNDLGGDVNSTEERQAEQIAEMSTAALRRILAHWQREPSRPFPMVRVSGIGQVSVGLLRDELDRRSDEAS